MKTIFRTLGAAVALSMTLAVPHAAVAQALTIEDIVALKRVSGVRLSPDGSQVAYLLSVPREVYVDADGRAYTELHVVNLEGQSRPFVTGDVNVANFE